MMMLNIYFQNHLFVLSSIKLKIYEAEPGNAETMFVGGGVGANGILSLSSKNG
jgi:hypothetical protein